MMQGRKIKNNKEDLELVREDLSSIYIQRVRDSLVHRYSSAVAEEKKLFLFSGEKKKKEQSQHLKIMR